MNILHISTNNENCGIGKYQEMYIAAMHSVDSKVVNKFFFVSPNKMRDQTKAQFQDTMEKLSVDLKDYDIVHIQHEFSFFSKGQLAEIVSRIKLAGKPFISTVHTKPTLHSFESSRLSPKWPVKKLRSEIANKRDVSLVLPLSEGVFTIVHNTFTRNRLIEIGFIPDRIVMKPIPVPATHHTADHFDKEIEFIKSKVHYEKGDFIFAAVGYLNYVKGSIHIVKALNFLPPNYKLLIFGGIHPRGKNDEFLDEIADFIVKNKLQNRVYISGFVESDDLLNAYVASADLVVYPYLRNYASSSAALNNGFGNEKPVLAFPVDSFKEVLLEGKEVMTFCESFSYYDLAKAILLFNPEKIKEASVVSKKYKDTFSYKILSASLLDLYRKISST